MTSAWRLSAAPVAGPSPFMAPRAPRVAIQPVAGPMEVEVATLRTPSTQGIWVLILVLAVVFVLAAVALEIVYLTPLVRTTGTGRTLGLMMGLLTR